MSLQDKLNKRFENQRKGMQKRKRSARKNFGTDSGITPIRSGSTANISKEYRFLGKEYV